jgi:deoxyribodipyrimidine photo-lyase
VKQARDQDPQGAFVRRWIPALAGVPDPWIFEPWTMPESIQSRAGVRLGRDYPLPVVDLLPATRSARERLHAVRGRAEVRSQASAVYERHGSRNPAREGTPQRNAARGVPRDVQPDLFDSETSD